MIDVRDVATTDLPDVWRDDLCPNCGGAGLMLIEDRTYRCVDFDDFGLMAPGCGATFTLRER
jgi:hypothetical protein